MAVGGIMQLAAAFRYCPHCGAALDEPGRNPLRCGHCDFTFYFSPVTGVVCIIANAAGEVLLFRRARDPGRGLFGLPGGFVDPGESAHEAAVREVREETGLEVIRLTYLGSFPNQYDYRGVTIPVTDLIYACDVASFEPLRAHPEEITEFHLCHPGANELGHMAFASNRLGLELFLASQRSAESPAKLMKILRHPPTA